MKIELKKIKINFEFSEATTMFRAELWVDGKCVGEAENRGNGGATDYNTRSQEDWDCVQRAEDYCQQINTCLEDYIDTLLQKHLDNKFQNELRKDLEKYICYSKDNSIESCKTYRPIILKPHISLDKLFNTPNYKVLIIKKINELKKDGFYILNENLPL